MLRICMPKENEAKERALFEGIFVPAAQNRE